MTIHRTTLVLLAGTALPIPAIGATPAPVPVMPEQIEDSCDLYALVDSTAMVTTYAAVRIEDRDVDGTVTDADFAEWIKEHIAPNLVIHDVNGDGYLTAVDEVAALAVVLDKLSGDLDADGTVTLDDTALFLDLFLTPPPGNAGLSDLSADVTLDGAVTAEDLNAHITTLNPGTQTDRVADAVKVLITLQGSLTQSHYSNGHLWEITAQWGDQHCPRTSVFESSRDRNRYPPNHDYTFSAGWPGDHSRQTSRNWPPQHTATVSEGWGPPGTDPGEHRTGTSRGWPPQHEASQSELWGVPDGMHSPSVSSRWPPNHLYSESVMGNLPQHDAVMSAITSNPNYPPDGYPENPGTIPSPTEHDANFSDGWDAGHGQATSRFFWPSNHSVAMSATWRSQHGVGLSSYWPAHHHGDVSRTWPADDNGIPPWWKPNHVTDISTRGPAVDPPPGFPWQIPFFPEGHSVWTSIQDLIPFLD